MAKKFSIIILAMETREKRSFSEMHDDENECRCQQHKKNPKICFCPSGVYLYFPEPYGLIYKPYKTSLRDVVHYANSTKEASEFSFFCFNLVSDLKLSLE